MSHELQWVPAPQAPSRAFQEGFVACQQGLSVSDNPYTCSPEETLSAEERDWATGWKMADDQNLSFEFVRRHALQAPDWSHEKIQPWESVYSLAMHPFITHEYWTDTGSVNVFCVVGTMHADYQGKTWLEFLMGGRRMPINLRWMSDNPRYYLEPAVRSPKIDYYTLDGLHYYVGSDGNHRTCLARFFLNDEARSQLHDVTVYHWKVDQAFYRLYGQLNQLLIDARMSVTLTPERKSQGRRDTSGWKVDCYEPYLRWQDHESGQDIHLSRDQAQEKVQEFLSRTVESPPSAGRLSWRQKLRRKFSGEA